MLNFGLILKINKRCIICKWITMKRNGIILIGQFIIQWLTIVDFYEICIFLDFVIFFWKTGVSYNYISPDRKFYEEFKYAVELLIGSKGEWDMDLAKIHFCGPQNPNIFSHKISVPDPISYWMPYLNSSWNFLSENVYFWYGRAKLFQVKLSWSSRGAHFSESGDVTLRVASSKRMAIHVLVTFDLNTEAG